MSDFMTSLDPLGPESNAWEYSQKAGNLNDCHHCVCYWWQFSLTLVFSATHYMWTEVSVWHRMVNHFHSVTPLHHFIFA